MRADDPPHLAGKAVSVAFAQQILAWPVAPPFGMDKIYDQFPPYGQGFAAFRAIAATGLATGQARHVPTPGQTYLPKEVDQSPDDIAVMGLTCLAFGQAIM